MGADCMKWRIERLLSHISAKFRILSTNESIDFHLCPVYTLIYLLKWRGAEANE